MKIKTKLLLFIGGTLVFLLSLTFYILISLTAGKITKDISTQLSDSSDSIVDQVSILLSTTARSYLMAEGSELNNMINSFTQLSKDGVIPESKLNELITTTVSRIKFMKSGYIFLTDEEGIIISHPEPEKIGTKASTATWILSLHPSDKSFHSYTYKDRTKLMYRVFNKELKINICASAYTADFLKAIDSNKLNSIMNNIKLGKTGYPFLIRSDGVIISHPSDGLLYTNIAKLSDSSGNLMYKDIRANPEGNFIQKWMEPDGKTRDRFTNFQYDKYSELTICTTGYIDEFYEIVDDITKIMLIAGLIMIPILLIIIFFVSATVVKPILHFTDSLKEISHGNGDLTKRITMHTKSEIGIMVNIFNNFLDTLQNIIKKIKVSAENTVDIKDEITFGVDETSSALYEISINIDSINSQTRKLNNNVENSVASISKISTNIEDLNKSVDSQSEILQTSTAAITEMISSIDNVSKITTSKQASANKLVGNADEGTKIIDETLSAVEEVNNQLESIKEMANVISGIASQTNLLAMNAAIEAAHAGDSGKGFAVVADEIRKLAETSDINSKLITETLSKIESSIISADSLSKKTQKTFYLINMEINEIVDALKGIDISTNELQIGGQDILESISNLEKVSAVVQSKVFSIKNESEDVQTSMNNTKKITLDVVTAIDEIGQGTAEISDSMTKVSSNTNKLKETGENLKDNVNRFKTH